MKPWKMGFLGAATDELAIWAGETVVEKNIQSIGVPFLGSAKAISMMGLRSEVEIESWDLQYVCSLIINDLFNAQEPKRNIDKPRLLRGPTFEDRPFDHMSDRVAGLIDYIATTGTGYERLALATAIVGCTHRGRLDSWMENRQDSALWGTFQNRLVKQEGYLGLPASFTHYENDFYSSLPDRSYDLLYIDPPKIITNTDVYSTTFRRLNRMIGPDHQHMEFDRWSKYDYTGRMRGVLDNVQSKHMMFVYTSDVRPGISTLKILFEDYGELVEEKRFRHRARIDYGLLYRRTA